MRKVFPHGTGTTLSDGRHISVREVAPGDVRIEITGPDDKSKYVIDSDQLDRLKFPGDVDVSPLLAFRYEIIERPERELTGYEKRALGCD